jgi:hypothetical protein
MSYPSVGEIEAAIVSVLTGRIPGFRLPTVQKTLPVGGSRYLYTMSFEDAGISSVAHPTATSLSYRSGWFWPGMNWPDEPHTNPPEIYLNYSTSWPLFSKEFTTLDELKQILAGLDLFNNAEAQRRQREATERKRQEEAARQRIVDRMKPLCAGAFDQSVATNMISRLIQNIDAKTRRTGEEDGFFFGDAIDAGAKVELLMNEIDAYVSRKLRADVTDAVRREMQVVQFSRGFRRS